MAATSNSTEPPNKTASSSIYLDCEDGERGKKKSARRTKDQPPKRLTMVRTCHTVYYVGITVVVCTWPVPSCRGLEFKTICVPVFDIESQ